MAFDNNDVEPSVEEAGPPPSESSNRSFLIVAGILGALLLLSLICVAAYAFLILPSSKRAQATANAAAIARATDAALSIAADRAGPGMDSYPHTSQGYQDSAPDQHSGRGDSHHLGANE